jgi:hypothetical protein
MKLILKKNLHYLLKKKSNEFNSEEKNLDPYNDDDYLKFLLLPFIYFLRNDNNRNYYKINNYEKIFIILIFNFFIFIIFILYLGFLAKIM